MGVVVVVVQVFDMCGDQIVFYFVKLGCVNFVGQFRQVWWCIVFYVDCGRIMCQELFIVLGVRCIVVCNGGCVCCIGFMMVQCVVFYRVFVVQGGGIDIKLEVVVKQLLGGFCFDVLDVCFRNIV